MGGDLGAAGQPLWSDGNAASAGQALVGDTDADVAIVGAGYTGLWTAHYLLAGDPSLRVVLVEAETAGSGASGRNGGWCSALFAAGWPRVARLGGGSAGALALRAALIDTVDEVGGWADRHGIDVDWAKGGTLILARSPAQVQRLQAHVAEERSWGATPEDLCWLSGAAARERIAASEVLGGTFTPHCAALHPAKLARGLARVVVGQGATVYEHTPATSLEAGCVHTPSEVVRARTVVRATEGYTAGLPGSRRLLAPIWSLVVATEPIEEGTWAEIGWRDRETLSDGRHLRIYAQRTADGRIAFGGRGAPYLFGSSRTANPAVAATYRHLETELRALFPALVGVRITHRWAGVLGVPRDWIPSVGLDLGSGLAWAGGYVGDGVGCSNLAGRTLADLILDRDTDLVRLPWVGHDWRRWEPEPLRWMGIRGVARLMTTADRAEKTSGRPSRLAALAGRLTGG